MIRFSTLVGSIALVLACAPTASIPEDDGGGSGGATTAPSSSTEDAVPTSSSSTGATPGGTTDVATTEAAESSSSSGEVIEGPGCDPAPACDRGAFEGSLRVSSAEQIADIAGYTSVTGWLEIRETDLVCLSFLACLEEVGHDLHIFGNASLRDVEGLGALRALGTATADEPHPDRDGSLVITSNNALVEIAGLGSLGEIQSSLMIADNEVLEAVNGLQALEGTTQNFAIIRNPALTDVDGVKDLVYIGGECQISQNANLCMSDVFLVCGDLENGPRDGNTEGNLAGC